MYLNITVDYQSYAFLRVKATDATLHKTQSTLGGTFNGEFLTLEHFPGTGFQVTNHETGEEFRFNVSFRYYQAVSNPADAPSGAYIFHPVSSKSNYYGLLTK